MVSPKYCSFQDISLHDFARMIFRSVTFLLFTCFLTCTSAQNDMLNRRVLEIFGTNKPDPVTTNPVTGVPINPDDCLCVEYYLCDDSRVNTNGRGLIDIRGNDNGCASYQEWCCKLEDITEGGVIKTNDSKHSGCGWRNPEGVGFRITGAFNREAEFGEFPWMVAVLYDEEIEGEQLKVYQCGGSLIHPQVVMTAAHCVIDRKKIFWIRAGEWDTQTTKEIFPHQNRKVRSITIHPEYYSGALYNDVALAIVESPFVLDQHINTACLPPPNTFTADGTTCWASGWGKDQFGAVGKYQMIMKKLDLPFVNSNKCQDKLRTTRLGKYFQLHKSFVCAGGEKGKDTCKGDGGGPLACPIPGQSGRYHQLGIVAWGIGCGEGGVPGVYANVASFRSWLDDQMKIQGFGTSSYNY